MNVLWGRVVVLGVVLLLVFLLGRATGGNSSEVEALQERVEAQNAEIEELERENRELASPPPDPAAAGTEVTGEAESPGTTGAATTTGTPAATPGTTATPTGTASPAPTGTAPGSTQAQNYTVRPGDTLSRISNRFYGSAAFARCIQTANNIADAGALQVGKSLTIPPKPAQPCT